MDRATLTRSVVRRLADPAFRRLLTAHNDDYEHHLVVALTSDPMRTVLKQLDDAGGSGNLVVPIANGFLGIAIQQDAVVTAGDEVPELTQDCTVGVFVARIMADLAPGASGSYRFAVDRDHRSGRAELVAVTGG